MILHRTSKPTLTPFHLDHEDALLFTTAAGKAWKLQLLRTSAEITARTTMGGVARDRDAKQGDIAAYAFSCEVLINGQAHTIRREVGTQASFYEPLEVDGVHVWFDAASCIFDEAGGFMGEKDWRAGFICRPAKHARFGVHESHLPICPEPIYPWYDNPSRKLDIRNCYNGEDCWMGPYSGGAAHCGLDINTPRGTILSAPINFDDHYLFHSVAAGFNNNRWRGVRRWPDGSEWHLQCHHQMDMLVPERTPLKAGTPYATGAGVWVGSHDHNHFMFRILEQGGEYWIDPWILFWAMWR